MGSSCDSLVKQEQFEFGYPTLRLTPLQYTFSSPEIYDMDETATQQHIYSDPSSLPDLYFSEEIISSRSVSQHAKEEEEEFETDKSKRESGFDCDCLTVSDDTVVPPVSCVSDDEVCSCTNDTEENRNSGNGSLSPSTPLHHRKRKTSALRLPSSCDVKKYCVEERQLTGLISVFNSGLSVVADQFLARPTASSVSSLQQTPKQINSFIHITCNPLIC